MRLNPLPGLKTTCHPPGRRRSSPVRGFLKRRGPLRLKKKLPNPLSSTLLPLANSSAIFENTTPTTSSQSTRRRSGKRLCSRRASSFLRTTTAADIGYRTPETASSPPRSPFMSPCPSLVPLSSRSRRNSSTLSSLGFTSLGLPSMPPN